MVKGTMKNKIISLIICTCLLTSLSFAGLSINAKADEASDQAILAAEALMSEHPTVSKEAWNARYINSTSELTPEQYVYYMYSDPTFDLKAYMYYNEDLMSKYTYSYWQYYKHYLEKGIMEKRIHFFPLDDAYQTVTLGRYQTKYHDNTQRGNNVRLAASSINGTILLPGQEFSFNNVVGQRTAARGYKIAHVYVNKQVVDGIGGGICQVSSTLYVAMMIAGLQATERHVHCLPVDYLKPNLDATINWGTCDLRFINTFDFPIVILASGSPEGILTVNICKYLG